ncbi:MAG TPA: tRNA (adenosine(37)-N6)-dimethylallyltransferase MiaA [Candidatus Aminicenantes bacterium]|nr:MAG: tRNA (adenosine(37)-N6)-dimethylallyltransferase MiaA [Candidatus Aminicenantes bacterium]HEK86536.1 tRNA (adenosine(37)-N6)-dimethylallyltransferase MiaA [Candidatus Aminicenantes bacterium]
MAGKLNKVLIIVGPTAVGKSLIALRIAQKFSGEIINCDSMQVYRGFDIGTDKPSAESRKLVPHHLIDILEAEEQFSAADFARLAVETIEEVSEKGHLPIVVGGTGLYHKALVEGLFPGPGRDPSWRQKLRQEAEEKGLNHLYTRLQEIDPEYAQKITPGDKIRIIRALEVYYLTGKPISEHFSKTVSPIKNKGFLLYQIGLKLDRKELYRRIEERVDRMFAQGIVEEVKALVASGISTEAAPFKGLGYRQVLSFLNGEISLEQTIRLTKIETRHYAKRQLTWFKKSPGIVWFEAKDIENIEKYIREKVLE